MSSFKGLLLMVCMGNGFESSIVLKEFVGSISGLNAHVSTRTATRCSSSMTGRGTLPVRSISWMHWLFQRATLRVVKLSRPSTSRTKTICCSSSSMAWAHSGVAAMGVCLAVCAAAVSDAPEK